MSISEIKPNSENKDSNEDNDDIDIYSDVLTDQDSLISKLKGKAEKLSKEKELLLKSLSSLQKNYEDLRKDYDDLQEKFKVVSFNSSALFKTAQAEIKRKDKLINELRKEKEDIIFRKTSVNQALQRSRKYAALSPRKYKSPVKNYRNPVCPKSTKAPVEEQVHFTPAREALGESKTLTSTKEPTEEAKDYKSTNEPSVPKETLEVSDSKPSGEPLKEFKSAISIKSTLEKNSVSEVLSVHVDKDNLQTAEVHGDKICSVSKHSVGKKANTVLPPLKGPSTAYSRRLYKRIHGASPPKASSTSDNEDISPKNTKAKPKLKSMETEQTTKNVINDCKVESVTSKLQKDVQEIIKLGSPTKTSPPLAAKVSQEKHKHYTPSSKNETLKQNISTPLVEKVIIQCDLRNKGSQKNAVSINETIDNILKKQKAGIYSPGSKVINNAKENELKKESLGNDSISKAVSKLLTNSNKKATDKPTISPVTFGKLVSHPAKTKPCLTPPSKATLDKSPVEARSDPRKRKLSESLTTDSHTSQRLTQQTCSKTTKKLKFISSLFGESPLKPTIINNVEMHQSTSKTPIKISTSPPIERSLKPSSPIFPDSPSLDSDNQEDLIIDTTACSQNTTPRVSESENKETDEICEVAEIKTFVLTNKPDPEFSIENVKIKESVTNVSNLADPGSSDKRNVCASSENAKTYDKTIPEIEISDCPTASNDQKNKLCSSTNIDKPKPGEVQNLHFETSHSSASLDKVSSPEKSSESQSLPLSDNSNTVLKNITKEVPVTRFIPSPPQLTLVSAFKHSENSVFALTEDTLGFVSALTRMRDISPIRTPDKKSKLCNKPMAQSQQSEPEIHSKSEMLKNNSFEFIKPLNQDSQNNSQSGCTLSVGLKKLNDGSPKCSKFDNSSLVDLASSCNFQSSSKAEKENRDSPKDKYLVEQSQKSRVLEGEREIDKITSNPSNTISSKIKNILRPNHNPFIRRKPVRRITNENKSELSPVSNLQSFLVETKSKNSAKDQENPEQENSKEIDITSHTNQPDKAMDVCGNKLSIPENKLVAEKTNSQILEEVKELEENTCLPDKSKNECPVKDIALSSFTLTNSQQVKTFKRSESLKMVRKPLPVNYLNVMKNLEDTKLKEEPEKSTTKTFEEFPSQESILDSKEDHTKVINKNSEIDKLSHIASINKKLRVSKYHGKPEKENFNQSKQLDTKCVSDNNPITDEKTTSQTTSLARDQLGVISRKEQGNKTKIQSASLSKGRRRNDRRSVSLGPEIRLRNPINLSSNPKNKQCSISLYNSTKYSKVTVNVNESNLIDSASKEIIKTSSRRSDESLEIESLNKESVTTKDIRTPTSDGKNFEKCSKVELSDNTSSRRHHIPQNFHTKSKSPEKENTNHHGKRRSPSNSPDCYKRSRSYHKTHQRKSPEPERKNHHNMSGSYCRSPEHRRSRNSRRYSPRRSDSGGRSRRSRYESHRRRSPSPDYRHNKYYEKGPRSRSSHYKFRDRSNRSRSISPDHTHRRYERRLRHKSRNWRSRSSSSHSHDRSSRSCSPHKQKSDCNMSNHFSRKHSTSAIEKSSSKNITDCKLNVQDEENDADTILSYKDMLEKMREEIETLKGKVNKKEVNSQEDSFSQITNSNNEHGVQQPKDDQSCKHPVFKSVGKSVEIAKTNISSQNEKNNCTLSMATVEVVVSETSKVKSINDLSQENNIESTLRNKETSSNKDLKVISQEKPKPIQVKRRVKRVMGDSEVEVVSIK